MIVDLLFLGCGLWGVWHFARATCVTFKDQYVLWSYSRASRGSRVYRRDDPGRFRIGAWTNVVGLALMALAVGVIAHDIISTRLGTLGPH